MKIKMPQFSKIVLFAAVAVPSMASAQDYILNTGTPTGSSEYIVSSASYIAAEFYAAAGTTITQLSVDLSSVSGNGNSLIFDLYSGSSIASRAHASDSTTATYNATAWTSANVDWVLPTAGDYWIAIAGNGSGTTYDAPGGTSASTVAPSALDFAFSSNSGNSFSTSTSGIGFEVTVVPEPATYGALAGVGLLGVSLRGQFRRKQA